MEILRGERLRTSQRPSIRWRRLSERTTLTSKRVTGSPPYSPTMAASAPTATSSVRGSRGSLPTREGPFEEVLRWWVAQEAVRRDREQTVLAFSRHKRISCCSLTWKDHRGSDALASLHRLKARCRNCSISSHCLGSDCRQRWQWLRVLRGGARAFEA